MKKIKPALALLSVLLLALTGIFLAPGCNSSDDDVPSELLALWKLQEFSLDGGAALAVRNPANYTVTFTADGTAYIKADCNNCSGSYSVGGSQMTFGQSMACTMAACGAASYDSQFLSALASTSSSEIKNGELYLTYQGGTLHFAK